MAWVELTLAPGLALPGSAACLLLPGKSSQQSQAPFLFLRLSCSNPGASVSHRGERGKEQLLPQQAPKLLSPTAAPAPLACALLSREVCSVEFKHPCKETAPRCLSDKRDIWQANVYIGGFYLFSSTSSKTSCPTFLLILELLTWY